MGGSLLVTLPPDTPARLDRALAEAVPAAAALSRSRLRALIEAGEVARAGGGTVTDPGTRVKAGERWRIGLPEPAPVRPEPEDLPLAVAFEDEHLIIVDKPAGMVVHPAPGATQGTLVNALLHHCGASLAGIGGALRPGIVHRIDKDTSGLIVAAKTEAAHRGLAARFARHEIERLYRAVLWGVPDRADPRLRGLPGVSLEGPAIRIATGIGRHPADRKRMAVRPEGRAAVTRLWVAERYGVASLAECRLETGRTHQIRVHMAHVGHAVVGDPVYARRRTMSPARAGPAAAAALLGFPRQALHAAVLGFVHPVTGAALRFEAPLPPDLHHLVVTLRQDCPAGS
jgi:23S rRNA pseudouridine1911/1915/1917 synthase